MCVICNQQGLIWVISCANKINNMGVVREIMTSKATCQTFAAVGKRNQ